MFDLNPLAAPDALWQHALMLVVAGVLGFIIGYISRTSVIKELKNEQSRVDSDLRYWKNQKTGHKISIAQQPLPALENKATPPLPDNHGNEEPTAV